MTHEYNPLNTEANSDSMRKHDEAAKTAEDRDVDDLKWVMSNRRGRRFICSCLDRAGVFRSSFNTNALTMAFAEGQRNEGLRLLAQINEHCPARYAELQKEQLDG